MSNWKRADLHVHTRHSGWRSLRMIDAQDCYVTPDDAFETARRRGMDYVCFTDHDTIDGALDFLARRPEDESRLIVGEEVEARFPDDPRTWIHLSVFDVDETLHDDMRRLCDDCHELIRELRRRDRFFVLNHPFQSFRSVRSAERRLAELLPLFPGVETCNSTSPASQRAIEPLLRRLTVPGQVRVGGSDAHTRQRIGAVYTVAPGDTKTEFLRSIRAGQCAVHGDSLGLAALLRDVYLIVGQYYASLYLHPQRMTRLAWLKNVLNSTVLLPGVVFGVPAVMTLLQAARQEWIARVGPWKQVRRSERTTLPSAGD